MIGIASDHGGYELKKRIIEELKEFNFKDFGTTSAESVDYPLYAFKLGEAVVNKEVEKGIVICTTGIGISIACNKVKGVRCAKVADIKEAEMCRLHNDANVLALNSQVENPIEIVRTFLTTEFLNEERHIRRINQIKKYEETNEY
jgi:ribose 5-phosphate isomerase B